LAGEAALDSAPDASSREDRVRLRREAMIRFELDRAPLAANRTIAHACRTSPATVATIRDALAEVPSTAPATPSRAHG